MRLKPIEAGRWLIVAAALIISILPIAWTLLASLNVTPNNYSTPPNWSWPPSFDSYIEIGTAEPNFWREMLTSATAAALTTLLAISVAFLAAYSLARTVFRGRKLLVQGCLVLASLPVIAYIIPLWAMLRRLHLHDTLPGLIFSEAALYAPLAVYVLHSYIVQLSPELEAAAQLDGATLLQVLSRIVLPIIAPGVAAIAIIIYVLSWNQLLLPLLITSTQVRTVPVMMSDFFTFERELEWPTAGAALIASLLPVGLFVALSHRLLERFSLVATQDLI